MFKEDRQPFGKPATKKSSKSCFYILQEEQKQSNSYVILFNVLNFHN